MSERRSRPGRVVGIAESVAAAVRRRQRDREPRVLLLDTAGQGHVVAPSAPGYDGLLEVADRMLARAPGGATRPAASADQGEPARRRAAAPRRREPPA